MIYLYWYLSIGVLVLAAVYGAHHLSKKKESDSLWELLEAVNPDRKKLSYRILNNFVVPILAAMLVVVAWPVAVYMMVKELFQKEEGYVSQEELKLAVEKEGYVSQEERKFAVEHEHLLERLTVLEIERREAVTDPLKAAPELPFGHLNAAWQAFLKGRAEGTELWSFSARWQTTWGHKELRCGYVVVQDGTPGAHFLTVWKDIPDDEAADGGA